MSRKPEEKHTQCYLDGIETKLLVSGSKPQILSWIWIRMPFPFNLPNFMQFRHCYPDGPYWHPPLSVVHQFWLPWIISVFCLFLSLSISSSTHTYSLGAHSNSPFCPQMYNFFCFKIAYPSKVFVMSWSCFQEWAWGEVFCLEHFIEKDKVLCIRHHPCFF